MPMGKTWIVRRWPSVVGALWLLEVAWKIVSGVLSTLGNVDFVVTHVKEPGWVGQMMDFIINPPGWFLIIALMGGFALLLWDARRSRPPAASVVKRDVWLSDALWRVVDGRWPKPNMKRALDDETRRNLALAEKKLTQAASDGVVPIWHVYSERGHYKPTPATLWKKRKLDIETAIGPPKDLKYLDLGNLDAKVKVPNPQFMTSRKAVEDWLAREG